VGNTAPTIGQVLKYDGVQWAPGTDNSGAFIIPYSAAANSAVNLISLTNSGNGAGLEGINSSSLANAYAIIGTLSSTTPGASSAAIKGVSKSTGPGGYGIWGQHVSNGYGVYGTTVGGAGVAGVSSGGGYGVSGKSSTAAGVYGTSDVGYGGQFFISNAASSSDAVRGVTSGLGSGISAKSTLGNGVFAEADDIASSSVVGIHNNGGDAIWGGTISNFGSGVVGRNDGTYAGVSGINAAYGGVGVLAQGNVGGALGGKALIAELITNNGNTADFKAAGVNVARIDDNGKGFFNGGTQTGGAYVAEFFDVAGNKNEYEPGDVLVISREADRKVEKSSIPYSTLVAGVYATKPGVLLTEKNAEQNDLESMVPMGVIGVIPTKVCLEGGAIKRGDLLVTSSIPGVAMKADTDKVKIGQVLGKALQDYNGNGTGKIKVLVSVK
jgi:hypothetical protein